MRQISPVNGNVDKQRTYREMLKKYKVALKEEFYFEALIVDYSMIEDRFRSFLYYIGALRNRKSYKIDGQKIKENIRPIVMQYSGQKTSSLGITALAGKLKIVRATLKWAQEADHIEKDDGYLYVLKSEYENLDIEGFIQVIDQIEKWKDYRNEVMHALMNKNMDSLYEELQDKVEEGMILARFVDGQVKILKRRNKVRKYLGLKAE